VKILFGKYGKSKMSNLKYANRRKRWLQS